MNAPASHPYLVDATHPAPSIPPSFQNSSQPPQLVFAASPTPNSYPQTQHLAATAGFSATDFGATDGDYVESSSLPSQSAAPQSFGRFNEEWDASQRGSSIVDGPTMQRSESAASQGDTLIPSRGGTLKKKASMKRGNSLRRNGSRRSSRAGSVRSLGLQADAHDEMHSAFFSPVPTTGNPTEVLANRFSAWRKVLKDLITYFREIQSQYDHRAKSLLKISNVINNTSTPNIFMKTGGIDDALVVLRNYHRDSIAAANKSKDIENDVILALTGLRSDLSQKIKEIKSLSGDFKNSVEKEMDSTRRAVHTLGEALGSADLDSAQTTGKQDPYLLRLAADRQVERQIDEENYLHQAYLNLETSGRELESIVIGEIQKSYNAYAGILKREGEEALKTVDELRFGPIAMPKDTEWNAFVENDNQFVDPRLPVRQAENIHYPGRDNEMAAEVRAGLLERKSKYLKSYTAGWYVLSPTHLHEFKSADKTQAPIMSLYLPDQKLGSHSSEGGSSNKFMLKGAQTGSMHRGHSWVFRAETHDTMMAWYDDIKTLTTTTPQQRNAFVRQHARSVSGTSQRAGSISSDGVLDEEDEEPFSAANSSVVAASARSDALPKRPQPGGRFPSDLQVNTTRGLQAPLSPSSGSSGFGDQQDRDVIAAAADLPGSGIGEHYSPESYGATAASSSHAAQLNSYAQEDGVNPYTNEPINRDTFGAAPLAAGVGGAALGAAGVEAYKNHQAENAPEVATTEDAAKSYEHASHEAAKVASPDLDNQELRENVAAQESAVIASPDSAAAKESEALAASESAKVAAPDVTSPKAPSPTFPRDVSAIPAAVIMPTSNQQTYTPPEAEVTPTTIKSDPLSLTSLETTGLGTSEKAARDEAGSPYEAALRPITQRPNTLAEQIRAGQHHESTNTISQLHIPGEFPRNSVVSLSDDAPVANKNLPV